PDQHVPIIGMDNTDDGIEHVEPAGIESIGSCGRQRRLVSMPAAPEVPHEEDDTERAERARAKRLAVRSGLDRANRALPRPKRRPDVDRPRKTDRKSVVEGEGGRG